MHMIPRVRVLLLAAAVIAWVMVGCYGLCSVSVVAQPGIVLGLGAVIATVGACGGLALYWLVAEEVDFSRRGYRVRHLRATGRSRWTLGVKACVYEELAGGGVRGLPFTRIVVESGYPSRSDVLVPDEVSWDARVPAWAWGRRVEIVDRIVNELDRSVTRVVAA